MAIKYLDAKRIRGSSTGTKTSADFEETFSGAGHTSDGTTVNGWTANDVSVLRYEGMSGTGLTGVANFDGDDKVTLGGSASDYNFLTTGFSIAFWVKPDAIANNNTVFDNTNGSASANGIVIRWEDSEKKIRLMIGSSGSGGGNIISDGNEMVLNEWQHLAFTYDGTTARIYRNGTEIKNGSITSHTGTAANVPAIGDCVGGGDSGYDGAIQDFIITNDTLTTGEITSLTNGSVASANLNNQKIHYPLTANFNDSSGGLGNGTAAGNAAINTTTKGKQGDNLHFNLSGTADDIMYYDLQHADALNGSNANATSWTLRMKINVTTKSGSTQNGTQFVLGLSASNAFSGARDFMGVEIVQSHNTTAWNTMNNATVNAGYPQNNLDSTGEFLGGSGNTIDLASGTDWWLDITRDGDDCTCTLYTDEFSGTSYTATVTTSSITDLRYIFFGNYSAEATFIGTIDDIKFYDGGMTQDEKATLGTRIYASGTGTGGNFDTASNVSVNSNVSTPSGLGDDTILANNTKLAWSASGTTVIPHHADFTMAYWLYPTDVDAGSPSTNQSWIQPSSGSAPVRAEQMWSGGANKVSFIVTDDDGDNAGSSYTFTPTDDTWHLFIGDFDASTGKSTYYCGKVGTDSTPQELGNNTDSGCKGASSSTELRTIAGNDSEYFKGRWGEFCIWNKVLSSSERSSLYNSGNGAKANTVAKANITAYFDGSSATGVNLASDALEYNLPENTLFEETDTYKQYWLQNGVWRPRSPTFENDFSSWSINSEQAVVSGVLDLQMTGYSTDGYAVYDLGASNALTGDFVVRAKMKFISNSNSGRYFLWLGSANNSGALQGEDMYGFDVHDENKIRVMASDTSNALSTGNMNSTAMSAGTTYYWELIRDGNTLTGTIRTGSYSGTILGSASTKTLDGTTNQPTSVSLRYVGFKSTKAGQDWVYSNSNVQYDCEEFKVWKGVTEP